MPHPVYAKKHQSQCDVWLKYSYVLYYYAIDTSHCLR